MSDPYMIKEVLQLMDKNDIIELFITMYESKEKQIQHIKVDLDPFDDMLELEDCIDDLD